MPRSLYYSLLTKLTGPTRRAQVNTLGNVSTMFGLMLATLLGIGGLAVDYTRAVRAQTLLQTSLDAAVLAAVQQDTREAAETALSNYLAVHSEKFTSPVQVKAVSFDGVTLQAEVESNVKLTVGAVTGTPSWTVKAVASAVRASQYQDLYFAIDLSGSMGVGATDADRSALEALTQPYVSSFYGSKLPQGCAFGCHRREGWEPDTKTVYQMAREAGINLREDELRKQFEGLVDLLLNPSDEAVQKGMRQLSVIAFSRFAQKLIDPSTSADAIKSSIDSFPYSERYETQYGNAFPEFEKILGTQGDGTQDNPKKALILITDGIESRDAFFAQSAIDQSLCDSLKSKGFLLAIVELKYPKLFSNALYNDTVLPVETTITPAIQQCASPGWYFQAVNNDDVPVKFQELKDKIATSTTRIIK